MTPHTVDLAAQVDSVTAEHNYSIRYDVAADTRLDAIAKATALLRSDVRLRGVNDADEFAPGWWRVSLNVWEEA